MWVLSQKAVTVSQHTACTMLIFYKCNITFVSQPTYFSGTIEIIYDTSFMRAAESGAVTEGLHITNFVDCYTASDWLGLKNKSYLNFLKM